MTEVESMSVFQWKNFIPFVFHCGTTSICFFDYPIFYKCNTFTSTDWNIHCKFLTENEYRVIILIKSREAPLEGIKISLSFSRHSWNFKNNKASVLGMWYFHNLIQNAWILEFWTHSKKESTVFYVHVLIILVSVS